MNRDPFLIKYRLLTTIISVRRTSPTAILTWLLRDLISRVRNAHRNRRLRRQGEW